ncbi:MAG: hypothetical protein GX265_05280 [Mollicutes bacterium]|nr:hypothetical protein [Mollicutes bacterium]
MKRIIPYILSLILGALFGYLLFQDADFDLKEVFANTINAKAFQIGVFNNEDGAKKLKEKYPDAIIVTDEDVFRVYYSILTNDEVINKMEKYLTKQNINYYIRNITINDEALIKALIEYESAMLSGSEKVLISLNSLIMTSYQGG